MKKINLFKQKNDSTKMSYKSEGKKKIQRNFASWLGFIFKVQFASNSQHFSNSGDFTVETF